MRATRATSRRELKFRKAAWASGIRGYRVQPRLPGRPDMYFPRLRLAVFVHGCFWHRCPACGLREPKANAEFWQRKFRENVERDRRVESELAQLGIETMTIWEHEVRADDMVRVRVLAAEIDHRRHVVGELSPTRGRAHQDSHGIATRCSSETCRRGSLDDARRRQRHPS